ncbi:hypothetical protein [Streptomyces alboflavus]|uniref:hypothetical protein n=1 Tax=Streptomyces alboflavus TaxID=67267 RepID=UPI0004C0AD8E|nr:hypothetical protein [Streptomyces alboflavus]
MTLRPARKLALTTAASAALLTALLTWQAVAADSDGTGRESRPGAGAAVSDTARTKTGKESPATPGKKPGKAPAKASDTTTGEVEHGGTDAAGYWTPERMRDAQPAPMPVVER